ncbi:hypothetical protein ACTFIW_000793 [Dictyostelium discoideum]
MGKIQLIEQEEFTLVTSTDLVLVDFYADWCGPCRMLTPVLEQLHDDQKETLSIVKIGIDKAQDIAHRHKITSIPTLLFFKDGAMVKQVVGLKSLQDLQEIIAQISM